MRFERHLCFGQVQDAITPKEVLVDLSPRTPLILRNLFQTIGSRGGQHTHLSNKNAVLAVYKPSITRPRVSARVHTYSCPEDEMSRENVLDSHSEDSAAVALPSTRRWPQNTYVQQKSPPGSAFVSPNLGHSFLFPGSTITAVTVTSHGGSFSKLPRLQPRLGKRRRGSMLRLGLTSPPLLRSKTRYTEISKSPNRVRWVQLGTDPLDIRRTKCSAKQAETASALNHLTSESE